MSPDKLKMKPWLTYIRVIVIAALVVIIVRTLFVTSCFIPSSGMENTLYRGEGVLVGKAASFRRQTGGYSGFQ